MESKFNTHGISYNNTCPICDSRTYIIHKKESNMGENTSWENESTMKLLGLDYVESQMRFCPACFHLFHLPMFNESFIYGKEGAECRKQAYEKYFPGQVYGGGEKYYEKGWFIKNEEVFSHLTHIFAHINRRLRKVGPNEKLKILDWGGGDGYLVETISLISKKVLGVECKAYCFDYHEWAADSHSTYFDYISLENLEKEAHFHIIFLSHIIEHVAFPKELLLKCLERLSRDGIIMVVVPYEVHSVLSRKSGLINYHQQLFSVTSLTELLKGCHFKDINVKLYKSSYRGNRMWSILACASVNGTVPEFKIGDYLIDIFNFLNILFRLVSRKFIKSLLTR